MPPTLFLPETTLFWGTGGDVAGQAWLGALISPHVLQAWAPTGEGREGKELGTTIPAPRAWPLSKSHGLMR